MRHLQTLKAGSTCPAPPHEAADILGPAPLVRHAFAGESLAPVWQHLLARIAAHPDDAAAFLDMSVVLQIAGHREKGLEMQASALGIRRCFRQTIGSGAGLRVLALATAGDLMANTPLDFLLEGADATLFTVFVDAETTHLGNLPAHDVAFIAIGESEATLPVLQNLQRLLRGWRGPIMNSAPERIMALTRDRVAMFFAGEPAVLAPATHRVHREALLQGESGARFPFLLRPIGSHGGQGMEKIDSREALCAFLASRQEQEFYRADFVDYSGEDGLFRKYRIAFIEGRPFASHLAVSEHWMVHYLSAAMAENPARRAEEAAWMHDFDAVFARCHAAAFEALNRHIGLDYFAIDCAQTRDGKLLLFEADTAMIVHAMDPQDLFPYKKPAMRKLFDAFQSALRRRAGS